MDNFHQADFFEPLKDLGVRCRLCPHFCLLNVGQTGICGVRKNINGILYASNYGIVSALHLDPIEKKPLYHFYPGREILSVGTIGCNLFCNFCQNWEIAHPQNDLFFIKKMNPDKIVAKALAQKNNLGMAYTYNEPVVFYEFMMETAQLVHQCGLMNVMVSNGFISPLAMEKLLPSIDAFNIDLKGFTNEFYKKYTKSELQPVLDSLKLIFASGKWLEITFLLIPGANDDINDFMRMIDWIAEQLSIDVPLHISRYFPNYKLNTHKTPGEQLEMFYQKAAKSLSYVYIGNYASIARNTFCPHCGAELITRNAHSVLNRLKAGTNICPDCKKIVYLVN